MSTVGVMFFRCPQCRAVRPLTIGLTPSEIGRALTRVCAHCARRAPRLGHRAGMSQLDTANYLAYELAFINEHPETAARRLGTTPEALARRFYRVGMVDLARRFQRVAAAHRRQRRDAVA